MSDTENNLNIETTSPDDVILEEEIQPLPSGMKKATSLKDIADHHAPSKLELRPFKHPSNHNTHVEYDLNLFGKTVKSNRDWTGWAKILGFYFIYYSFLVFILYASVLSKNFGYWQIKLPINLPKTQARLQSPGLSVYPIMLSGNGHRPTADIGHVIDRSTSEKREWYTKQMQALSTIYTNSALSNFYSNFTWIEDECTSDYGYGENGSPCVVFSLNNIINWQLKGLSGSEALTMQDGSSINPDDEHAHIHCDMWEVSGTDNKITYDAVSSHYTLDWIEPCGTNCNSGAYSDGKTSLPGAIHQKFYPFTGITDGHKNTDVVNTDEFKPIRGNKPFKVLKITKTDPSSPAKKVNFKCGVYADNIHTAILDTSSDIKMYKWRLNGKKDQSNNACNIAYANAVLAEFTMES